MRVLALADLNGNKARLQALPELVRSQRAGAVFVAGNILNGDQRLARWQAIQRGEITPCVPDPLVQAQEERDIRLLDHVFRTFDELNVPVFHVPGMLDAPERLYYQLAANHEVIAGRVQSVHRAPAFLDNHWVVAGFGGEISTRDQEEHYYVLEYPAWKAELALTFLRRFEQPLVLLFHTAAPYPELSPEGDGRPGHQLIDHLVKEYKPLCAVFSGASAGQGSLVVGRTLVVNPGSFDRGEYAVIDLNERIATTGRL